MTTTGGKLARDSFWMISVQIFGRSLTLLFSIYAASVLGVEKFGIYGYVMAIITVVASISDFGANTFQIRQTAILSDLNKRKLLLASSLFIRTVLGSLGFFIIIILSFVLSHHETARWLLILFGIGLFFNNISGAYSSSLIGLEDFKLYGIISVSSQAINMGVACFLIYLGFGLLGIGYVFSVWGMLSCILIAGVFIHWHYGPKAIFSRKEITSFIRTATPLGLTAILVTIYYKSDYIILEYFKGTAEVGLYNAAYVVVNALIFLPTTISTTFLPKLSLYYESCSNKLEATYKYAFKFLFFSGFGLAFGAIAVSSDLIAVIYPNEYASSYLVLNILIWALALIFINSMQGNMLIATGKQKLLPYITGTSAIVNIGLNFAVIPRYGMRGAALTTVVSEIIAGGCCVYILRKINGASNIAGVIVKTLIAGSSMYMFLTAIKQYSLFIKIPLGIVIYLVILIAIKGVTKADLLPLREMVKRG